MIASNPLQSVSIKNYLGLFDENGDPILDKMTDFLSVSRKELAEAFGLSVDQVRPDRMSEIAKQRVSELAGILEFVADIFCGENKKALFWIKTPNPHFGGMSPREMIIRGRQRKVQAFVLAAIGREAGRIA
jgi:uncharacterized protein (DUF2384 family)